MTDQGRGGGLERHNLYGRLLAALHRRAATLHRETAI